MSFRYFYLLAALIFSVGVACFAQQPVPPTVFGGGTRTTPAEDAQRAKMVKDMEKHANEQRQAELERDTERLLKLATELKQQVGKSSENVMSLDVMKKAEEIERLAHNVREKMKGS